MTGVDAGGIADYEAAVAELPRSAERSDSAEGSVVVVDGSPGWPARVRGVVARGAAAVVVADPSPHDLTGLDDLLADAEHVPVVLDREFLRADVVQDAGADEQLRALVTGWCAAPDRALASVVCDTLGWLRALGSGGRIVSVGATGGGVVALLGGDVPGTLTARRLADPVSVPTLRATVLAPRRVEIELLSASRLSVLHTGSDGETRAPSRFESRQRLSLRRALDALSTHARLDDVEGFAQDATTTAALLTALTDAEAP